MNLFMLFQTINRFNFCVLVLAAHLSIFHTSCVDAKHRSGWDKQEISSESAKRKIKEYVKKIDFFYSVNPDSSIYYCHKAIDLYKAEGIPYGRFNINTKLAEIYLNRKGDLANAMLYHAEALKLMMQYQERETENPYFYTDMGNLLLQYEMTNEAIKNYSKSLHISKSIKNGYASSVAYNNLGLAYQSKLQYDSAQLYFNKALEIRKSKMPVLESQTYIYLAEMFEQRKIPDSMMHYQKLAVDKLAEQKYGTSDIKDIDLNYTIQLRDFLNVKALYLKAKHSELTGNTASAINDYYAVKLESTKLGEIFLPILCFYTNALLFQKNNNIKKAIENADSAFVRSQEAKNFEYTSKSAKLLAQLYQSDKNKSYYYQQKATDYADSILLMEKTKENEANRILLITADMEGTLRYYQKIQTQNHLLIETQASSIAGLAVLICILITLTSVIVVKYKRLNKKYLDNTKPTTKNWKEETPNLKIEKDLSLMNLEYKLVHAMNEQKVYTQKGLTLSSLSAMLDTNSNYLSQLINNYFHTGFNDYINSYRIKEACRIMMDDKSNKYSIDQVADMVGFTSRSTFYTTFKKFTGITPAFFLKNQPNIPDEDIDKARGL